MFWVKSNHALKMLPRNYYYLFFWLFWCTVFIMIFTFMRINSYCNTLYSRILIFDFVIVAVVIFVWIYLNKWPFVLLLAFWNRKIKAKKSITNYYYYYSPIINLFLLMSIYQYITKKKKKKFTLRAIYSILLLSEFQLEVSGTNTPNQPVSCSMCICLLICPCLCACTWYVYVQKKKQNSIFLIRSVANYYQPVWAYFSFIDCTSGCIAKRNGWNN